MNTQTIAVAIAALIIGALGGYYATGPMTPHTDDQMTEEHMMDADSSMSDHRHDELVELPAGIPTPTIALSVTRDPASGWNTHIETTNFTFAPEHASGEHVAGEGHAHIYVDGEKINRVYSDWYHLDDLGDGTHTVTVSLNTNDHRAYATGGEVIEASTNVTEGEDTATAGEGRSFELRIENGAITSGETTLAVTHGDTVTLRITSDVADELHVHGYDESVELEPGETIELTFDATLTGRFPFELEESKTELGALEVAP